MTYRPEGERATWNPEENQGRRYEQYQSSTKIGVGAAVLLCSIILIAALCSMFGVQL